MDVLEHLSDNPEADYVDVLTYIILGRTGLTRMPSDSEFVTAIKNNQTYNQSMAEELGDKATKLHDENLHTLSKSYPNRI